MRTIALGRLLSNLSTAAAATSRRAWQAGMDVALPRRCLLCYADLDEPPDPLEDTPWCAACSTGLHREDKPYCLRCGMPAPLGERAECVHCLGRRWNFHGVCRLGEYAGLVREAVLRGKSSAGDPVSATLGQRLAHAVAARWDDRTAGGGIRGHIDLVAAVPSHWWRRLRRGTNEAAILSQALAKRLRLPLANDLLVLRRRIAKQSELPIAQRRRNVRGAFRLSWGYNIRDARVLLVDDVMTTGATVNEISRVLKQAGAQQVLVAVVARAIGPDW
jgi:ComF family protein